ncbi:MAG: hypothetical protein AABY22_31630, partial [Nanoarchaeota archaeon]
MAIYRLYPGNLFDLQQNIVVSNTSCFASNILDLSSDVEVVAGQQKGASKSRFNVSGFATVKKVLNKTVSNSLSFVQVTHKSSIYRQIFDSIFFTQNSRLVKPGSSSNNFVINQNLVNHRTRGVNNLLTFVDTAIYKVTRSIIVTNQFIIVSSGLGYLLNRNFIASEQPIIAPRTTIELAVGLDKITLRAPKFDNNDSISLYRINKRNRGDDLIIAKDHKWPITEILSYEFEALSEKQYYDFLTFIKRNIGLDVTLTDHESRKWIGLIKEHDTFDELPQRGCENATYGCSFSFQIIVSYDFYKYINALYQANINRDAADWEISNWKQYLFNK